MNEERISELEKSLADMEDELSELYRDVGKQVLNRAEEEQKQLNQLVDNIVNTRKELSVLKNEIQCPNCMAFNESHSKYCNRCGHKLDAENIRRSENGTE